MDDWRPTDNDGFDEIEFPLDQRTEELYDINGVEPDAEGLIENTFTTPSFLVYI